MPDDADLLRRYAEDSSEEAFAELVRRRLDLVYSVALRQVGGDAHLASDVTQRVFTDLAAKASSLSRRPVLSGWLYRSAQFAASDVVRGERRRRVREQEAQAMQELTNEPARDADWKNLRPVIDEAMGELGERDRDAVMLRFFEERPFAEIGAALRLTEDAARMRVERALDKLRTLLARRGVTSTAAALGVALANQAAAAAPAGLAATVTGAALASAATGSAAAAITFMSMTKIGIAGAVVVAGATGLWWQHQMNARLEQEVAALQEQNRGLIRLRADNDGLIKLRGDDAAQLAMLQAELTRQKSLSALAPKPSAPKLAVTAPTAEGQAPVTLVTDLKPVTNAGKASSRAAAETFHWAVNGGDVATMTETISLTDVARQRMLEGFAALPPGKQAEFGTPEKMLATFLSATTPALGMQVMSDRPGARADGYDPGLANDPTYRTVHVQRQYTDGRVREQDMVFQQGPDGWRWVMPADIVTKMLAMGKPRPANAKPGG